MQQASKKPIAGQPSISITPLPRQSAAGSGASAASSSKVPTAAAAGMKPGQSPTAGNNKAQFVICEICDGYIKDLEQLRNHMQWMHKVKVILCKYCIPLELLLICIFSLFLCRYIPR